MKDRVNPHPGQGIEKRSCIGQILILKMKNKRAILKITKSNWIFFNFIKL